MGIFIYYPFHMHLIKNFLNEFIAEHTILFFIIIIFIIILAGTTAFYFLEWWTFFNSLYFTSVTMSTIWYGDMAPVTVAGKVVSMFYGFMGAPLLVWFTGIAFQSKFQKMLQRSIHAYHKEAKENEKITLQLEKENKKQDRKIKQIQEEVEGNM